MNRYSLDSDSRRWWWPPAGVGAAASLVILAVLAAPSSTASAPLPAPDQGSGLTVPGHPASALLDCPPPQDPRYVGVPWVPPVKTGCSSLDEWWADLRPPD
jgi:hypothetical protein